MSLNENVVKNLDKPTLFKLLARGEQPLSQRREDLIVNDMYDIVDKNGNVLFSKIYGAQGEVAKLAIKVLGQKQAQELGYKVVCHKTDLWCIDANQILKEIS